MTFLQFILLVFAVARVSISSLTGNMTGSSSFVPSDTYFITFVVPDRYEFVGEQCYRFSRYFCLVGFVTDSVHSNRQIQMGDVAEFRGLIAYNYHQFNYFSFRSEDLPYGCCNYQSNTFQANGQSFGYSPREYFNILSTLGNPLEKRDLVFITSRWDEQVCMNIIGQIDFGQGYFILDGAYEGTRFPFAFPPLGDSTEVLVISGQRVQPDLTFNRFLQNVVCKEKPNFCETSTSTTTPEQEDVRKRLFHDI
ncbi:uncharacterized protein LOC134857302 [Symsagittifera roscoffensis]|uniref:uncharacterized protein LOC134857302 n=1 Tax=Symsagittifera roscoffensis TaxID=84072 RepID=UPI00307B8767